MSKLKEAIDNQHLKRKDIAKKLGITPSTIWNFENNKHTKTIDTIKGFCELFEKKFEELF